MTSSTRYFVEYNEIILSSTAIFVNVTENISTSINLLFIGADCGKKIYHLTGPDGKIYDSVEPGTLGGHKKLKIYGRLDCPSAARYIEKGQYVQHRVFFKDEKTAIAAGYRPCGVCMKEAYKKWKAEKDK